jgi:hypothetical protein
VAGGIDAQLIAALEADERDGKRFDLEQARNERKQVDDVKQALDEMAMHERADVAENENLVPCPSAKQKSLEIAVFEGFMT